MGASKRTNLNLNETILSAVEKELNDDLIGSSVSQLTNKLYLKWLKEERGVDLVASKKSAPAAMMGRSLIGAM